jgi:dTDP-4-dehydrorhamnose reductase
VLAADRTALDLSRPDTIAAVLDALAPEVIVNAGAYTNVDQAEAEPALAAAVNARAPAALARWAAPRGVPLIQLSTDFVFGGAGEAPWREDDAPQPLSVYGATKLAGENEIRAAGGTFLILRTQWVYAARGRNFVRSIASLARERQELRVVADQIGAPTSAALLAEAIAGILAGGRLRDRCGTENARMRTRGRADPSGHIRRILDGGQTAAQFTPRPHALANGVPANPADLASGAGGRAG